MLSVLIIERDPIVAEQLRARLLALRYTVVGVRSNFWEALFDLPHPCRGPDLILLHHETGGDDRVRAMGRIVRLLYRSQVLLLSSCRYATRLETEFNVLHKPFTARQLKHCMYQLHNPTEIQLSP